MSNLHRSYNRILALLHDLEQQDNFLNQKRSPKMTDKELIALNLAAESLSIDSERNLFRRLPDVLVNKIERSVYNRRRRSLCVQLEQFRQQLVQRLCDDEPYHLIDSMPLEVCKFSRAKRARICHDNDVVAPDYGYCAAQGHYYFGYKLHAVCTRSGVLKNVDLSKASKHDLHYLQDIRDHYQDCVLIGDRGYLSHPLQTQLFDQHRIRLETPKRRNQTSYRPFNPMLRKARKRIETLYSQLCDQFMIRRNYAKTFQGLATRVLSKITALTMIQWFNHLQGRNINNLKIVVA